jgi:hypothetical protein
LTVLFIVVDLVRWRKSMGEVDRNPYRPENIDVHREVDEAIDQMEAYHPELKAIDAVLREAAYDTALKAYAMGLASTTKVPAGEEALGGLMDSRYLSGTGFVSVEDHVERTVSDFRKLFPVLRDISDDLRGILQTACEDLVEKVFPGYLTSGKQGDLDWGALGSLVKEAVAFVQRAVSLVSIEKDKPKAKDVAGGEKFLLLVELMARDLITKVEMSKKPVPEDNEL